MARVCISYNTVGMKWSSSSGACPKNHQQYRLGRARMEFWDWWGPPAGPVSANKIVLVIARLGVTVEMYENTSEKP